MALDPVITLIKDDPELMHRLMDAGSREERAAILAEFGVAIPDPEHVKAKMTALMAVTGGKGTALDAGMGALAAGSMAAGAA